MRISCQGNPVGSSAHFLRGRSLGVSFDYFVVNFLHVLGEELTGAGHVSVSDFAGS